MIDIGDGWPVVFVGLVIGALGFICALAWWADGIDRRRRVQERPPLRTTGTRNQRRASAR